MSQNLQANVKNLVTLTTYGNAPEAELAKAALEERGVSAHLLGADMATTLWHLGAAMDGIHLQVEQAEVDSANDILQSVLKQSKDSQTGGTWKCSACDAVVDAGNEVCWSCGATAEEASEPIAAGKLDARALPTSSADEIANRAWRAAIYGLMFPPLLIYAFVLMFKTTRDELSPAGRKTFNKTLACLIVCICFWGIVFFG